MAGPWRPRACPVARDQPFGYKHFHTERCYCASAEQIEEDRRYLESRTLRYRLMRLVRHAVALS